MRRNHPESPYGHSKLATERALAEAARATGIELVIIRPPLVYGPGVRANFEALLPGRERRAIALRGARQPPQLSPCR